MHFLEWMDKNNLYTIAKNHSVYFKKILKNQLKARNKEILILSDIGSYKYRIAPVLSCAYYLAAKNINLKTKLILQKPKLKQEKTEKQIIHALKEQKPGQIIICNMSNRLGYMPSKKTLRRLSKEKRNNFITTTSLGTLETGSIYLITRAFDIDYKKLQRRASKLKKQLDLARKIRIKTARGTDFTANITARNAISIDGFFENKLGGNMPAGEVYLAPNSETTNGKIIIDGSSRNRLGTTIIEKPITLIIKNGLIYQILGGKEAKILKSTLHLAKLNAQNPLDPFKIGEIGIGLNPNIDIVGAMVIDEKANKTAHIGIGSNSWFGGEIKTNIHIDQVFRNPVIELDNKEIKV